MFTPRLIRVLLLTSALIAPATPGRAADGRDQPVLLDADQMVYDETANTVAAEGNVTLVQNGQTVTADRMTYNRATDVVTASGHVQIWQPDGNRVTAAYAELSRDLRQAFVQQITLLMADNSRFISLEGERTDGRYVRMNRALYTACDLCRDDPRLPPLWQVRADRIIHDNERKDVIYRNATLELGGIPVFYTPYLSHPDPSVKRRSGFLAPVIGTRPNLGFVTRTYYYADIAPTMDATIETSYSADRGLLLGSNWRKTTAHGGVNLDVSATFDDVPNDNGVSPPESQQLRGHFFLSARHDFTPSWRGSVNLQRTTDDTFLDLWNYSDEDVLPSTLALEHFTPRSYGVLRLQSYQDLRPAITSAEPNVMTLGWQAQGTPRGLMGGRWFLAIENRSLTRSHGTDSNRAALATGWRREDILPAGIKFTTEATARMDGFVATNYNNSDTSTFRPFIQGQITASWPLVRIRESGQQFLEPVAQLTVAPRRPRSETDIPNEDSNGLEFDTTNLFSGNRYSGFDRVDGGQRVAYGLRAGWTGNDGTSLNAMAGQSYDFARRPGFATGTALEQQNSDLVGAVNATLPDLADVAYSFRLDQADFDPREHDLRATIGPSWLRGSVNYLYIDQTDVSGTSSSLREELGLGGNYRFAEFWTIGASHRRDLQRSDGALSSNLTLTYQDECLTFSLIGQRDHVARAGLSAGDSLFFRLIFRNLGEFESPSISSDIFASKKVE